MAKKDGLDLWDFENFSFFFVNANLGRELLFNAIYSYNVVIIING